MPREADGPMEIIEKNLRKMLDAYMLMVDHHEVYLLDKIDNVSKYVLPYVEIVSKDFTFPDVM